MISGTYQSPLLTVHPDTGQVQLLENNVMKAIVPGSGITVTASSDGRYATIDASSQLSASAPLIMIDNNTIMLDTSNLFFPVAPLHLTGDVSSGYSLIIDKGSLFTAVAPLSLTPSTPGNYNLTLGNLGAATATTIPTSGAATLNSRRHERLYDRRDIGRHRRDDPSERLVHWHSGCDR